MDLLPISALNHLLYCERRAALVHIEQAWAENQFTAEGNVMHEKAHGGISNLKSEISDSRTRIVRGLHVKSERLGLSGQCDVVEFHGGPHSPLCGDSILPIEYKRGKPKAHRADEVQLCAQALCLEEMLSSSRGDEALISMDANTPEESASSRRQLRVRIPEGRLFYGQTRRRLDVVFDAELRVLTGEAARRLHELIDHRETPPAVYEQRKCDACSLKELCMPQAMRFQKGVAAWFRSQISDLKFQISD